ncbi:pleckstrin homology domain-containing family O member 2 [Pantherophis guttatus]|uniref:Pleckstrin homology domain-containing family O member 2 n=1 Tax=Pantherophis guttatus TaxID=94885 RepID=A0A6P9CB75_PANGU|nr:pleckstrin homology domain-containing family O member 2 [Pantherophis guttatus]
MEDGLKQENSEKSKSPTSGDKVGWIKKSSGGLLSLWKERYIRLRKNQLLLYENEEEQKCAESLELEHYDRCQDLRALLKRKNRFILIHSPGCKVQDIKFQASTPEEKELWMKALNDGISRGKNKIFDEVKVDESLSLDHVTRGRAKIVKGRRPPTRSHLKEVANSMSDGILRLDLDVSDGGPPNSILVTSETAETPPPKETPKPPMPPVKVPMPPTENLSANLTPEDPQVKKPPMPPAKPLKEVAAPGENVNSVEGSDAEEMCEDCEEDEEGLAEIKPPVPPPKILSDKMKVGWDHPSSELHDVETENIKEAVKPPTPPPKVFRGSLISNDAQVDLSEGDQQPDGEANLDVNGIDDNGTTQPAFQNGKEQNDHSSEPAAKEEGLNLPSEDQIVEPVGGSPATKLRSSSLGALLSDSPKKPLRPDFQKSSLLHVVRMEKKIADEKERTEKLLQKVHCEELEQAQEGGKGPSVDAKELLNEATEQLRQATQVLQEVKDLGELRREPTSLRKGVSKDLVTVYRRSAP